MLKPIIFFIGRSIYTYLVIDAISTLVADVATAVYEDRAEKKQKAHAN